MSLAKLSDEGVGEVRGKRTGVKCISGCFVPPL